MCGKLYEHELQGNTEDENTIRVGRGVDDWTGKRKEGMGSGSLEHLTSPLSYFLKVLGILKRGTSHPSKVLSP